MPSQHKGSQLAFCWSINSCLTGNLVTWKTLPTL
ncbi:hypothetical protein CYB_2908 [Synechococcus sp. JA-2-3B'a(2-13)]|nr:hypothetical protein CYB_2908 [Synechococcus sp. JA-2-3B'a(2-13)]